MNNEIQRKITSLTLMTIMVAGGLTFAIPGVVPDAYAANPNLIVSAENSTFDNYMSGPQVIEVVVIDSDINDTNEGEGEPDVTVNGKDLRMVQATDGNWYGYFADLAQARIADSTATSTGSGLDFGTLCNNDSILSGDPDTVTIELGDTLGIAVGATFGTGGLTTADAEIDLDACTGAITANATAQNVLRETKTINSFASAADSADIAGQIGISPNAWPFIQLYEFNPTGNVVIQYNKGGGAQSTTLTFDTVDQFAGLELDRRTYPLNAQVHATITDLWLNIDPTDEDSWTFDTNIDGGIDTFYQVFDEDGGTGGSALTLSSQLGNLMCEKNCKLVVDTNAQNSAEPVLTLQSNDDSTLVFSGDSNNATSFSVADEAALGEGTVPVTITEQGPNTGVFGTYDESDTSVMIITDNSARGISASVGYNEAPKTILTGFDFATIDIAPGDDEWNSGEEIPITIVDGDANVNSRVDEDLDLNNPAVTIIPALSTGNPFTLAESGNDIQFTRYSVQIVADNANNTLDALVATPSGLANIATNTAPVDDFSDRAILPDSSATEATDAILIDLGVKANVLVDGIDEPIRDNRVGNTHNFHGFNFFNYDVRSFEPGNDDVDIFLITSTEEILNDAGTIPTDIVTDYLVTQLVDNDPGQGYLSLEDDVLRTALFSTINGSHNLGLIIQFENEVPIDDSDDPIVADFFSFGFTDDGVQANERIANQIIRIEAEETGDNTSTFTGSLEYVMVNQLNIIEEGTYAGISTIADDPSFIVIEDLTDEDSPRVSYADQGRDGVVTPISDQQEAPSHSGVVSLNQESYKVADTVEITLEDLDLNIDSDLVDIFTTVRADILQDLYPNDHDRAGQDINGVTDNDQVGSDVIPALEKLSFGSLGRLLDVTFDDAKWENRNTDNCIPIDADGLFDTGFTLVETDVSSGIFIGDFQIPRDWCNPNDRGDNADRAVTVTGLDIEVNYVDYRDASGEIVEVGDSAGVRASTGSVSLDRTVYPVPFGVPSNFADSDRESTDGRSVFPVHASGTDGEDGLERGEYLINGDLTIHIRVNDPDFDLNPAGEDTINRNNDGTEFGPVKVSVQRGSAEVILGYAGGPTAIAGPINVGDRDVDTTRQFGPMVEIAGDTGIFEYDLDIRYTDGPASDVCPNTVNYENIIGGTTTTLADRFAGEGDIGGDYCILQGDILQVEYTDPADASGNPNTVTDSATFDLRNGVLQSDKTVYIIGSDMILTLIEPDFDLDNDGAETYDLDLIEWDSDAATVSMGGNDGDRVEAAFDPEPTDFRETGDSTGVFQIVIEIPEELAGDNLERGEEIVLEYTDWGPSGSDYVGEEDEDVNLTVYTSNFGATIELDQKVYTWTDKVYITIVAPDHNFDSDLIDEIGDPQNDPISVSTRGADLDDYTLVETGTDTGIFTGEVILTGFAHDADGDSTTGENGNDIIDRAAEGTGPTNGLLPAGDDDGLTVSFEFSDNETVVGSALIRWNIGEVQWLEASYPASGTGVVRVIDPDMNLDPEAVDNFDVDVWSDADVGGIDLTVTETNEATGIFEGTVFFTVTDQSSGHRLRVAEGDTVTAEYEDNTLPDPYSTADEEEITATSIIGTIVPPLERVITANLRAIDAFGNSLDTVSVDQQVQIGADLASGQDKTQDFAYLVQIQDSNGVTVSLAWIVGELQAGQSFAPALSWTPTGAGSYTATAFVWESVDNPTALSPPVVTTINVS